MSAALVRKLEKEGLQWSREASGFYHVTRCRGPRPWLSGRGATLRAAYKDWQRITARIEKAAKEQGTDAPILRRPR